MCSQLVGVVPAKPSLPLLVLTSLEDGRSAVPCVEDLERTVRQPIPGDRKHRGVPDSASRAEARKESIGRGEGRSGSSLLLSKDL